MGAAVGELPASERADAAWAAAARICDEDVELCRRIGEHGLTLLEGLAEGGGGRPLNVLTHCNAGWLATVDWGTALAPVYMAHDAGVEVHVWVDETRPRNQGAALTAFELAAHGVPHTLIADNAGGHLMQHGKVDICLVGTDRTTAHGDVANKIGTYLKALAAYDNDVPFYVALPSTTIDWEISDGVAEIPIEERPPEELTLVHGRTSDGMLTTVEIAPPGCPAGNFAFDVTPARLITGLVTERGIGSASVDGLLTLFPERRGVGKNSI
jgi:methylthioribose-1-phosphate isomerase